MFFCSVCISLTLNMIFNIIYNIMVFYIIYNIITCRNKVKIKFYIRCKDDGYNLDFICDIKIDYINIF